MNFNKNIIITYRQHLQGVSLEWYSSVASVLRVLHKKYNKLPNFLSAITQKYLFIVS